MIIPNIWENKKCSKPPTSIEYDVPELCWIAKVYPQLTLAAWSSRVSPGKLQLLLDIQIVSLCMCVAGHPYHHVSWWYPHSNVQVLQGETTQCFIFVGLSTPLTVAILPHINSPGNQDMPLDLHATPLQETWSKDVKGNCLLFDEPWNLLKLL